MKRRDFFKRTGGVAVAVIVAPQMTPNAVSADLLDAPVLVWDASTCKWRPEKEV
jgi:hypothetical protein